MFDPLDMYGVDERKINDAEQLEHLPTIYSQSESENIDKFPTFDNNLENDADDDDMPIYVLDLPAVPYAPPEVILSILYLLRPDTQVNFQTNESFSAQEICKSKNLGDDLQKDIVEWYTNTFPNDKLNTLTQICSRIPALTHSSDTEKTNLLNYYTSILKKYENSHSNTIMKINILEEVSARIAECCGRSALPSMSRDFQFDHMNAKVSLFEPSLTADNLGWKTWGASLILSKTLVENFDSIESFKPKDKKLKVLELGSGTGLVGISWACKWKELYENKCNEIELYLTDLPDIVDNLKHNVSTNNLDSFVIADVLDWTDPSEFIEKYNTEDKTFDIILIADPIYSPNHPEWVVNMISKFLSPKGKCYLEIPIRSKYAKERQVLIDLLEKNDFDIINQRYDQGIDDWGPVKYLYREIIHK